MYTAKVKITAKSTLPHVRLQPRFLTGVYMSGNTKMKIEDKKEDLRKQILESYSLSNPECTDMNVEIREFKRLPMDFCVKGKEK